MGHAALGYAGVVPSFILMRSSTGWAAITVAPLGGAGADVTHYVSAGDGAACLGEVLIAPCVIAVDVCIDDIPNRFIRNRPHGRDHLISCKPAYMVSTKSTPSLPTCIVMLPPAPTSM